jgi:hypothetical protein
LSQGNDQNLAPGSEGNLTNAAREDQLKEPINELACPAQLGSLSLLLSLILAASGWMLFYEHPKYYGRWEDTVTARAERSEFRAPLGAVQTEPTAKYRFLSPDGESHSVTISGDVARQRIVTLRFARSYPEGAFIDPVPALRTEFAVLASVFAILLSLWIWLIWKTLRVLAIERLLQREGVRMVGTVKSIETTQEHFSKRRSGGGRATRTRYHLIVVAQNSEGAIVIRSRRYRKHPAVKEEGSITVLGHPTEPRIFRVIMSR